MQGVLPGETWEDALADRDARAALTRALAEALVQLFAQRGSFRKLIVHGAWNAARAYARGGAPHRWKECEKSAAAELLGEGEVAVAFWARRLAARAAGSPVVMRTVDTDLVLVGALHAAPGMMVQLQHFDRRTRTMVRVTIDAAALAAAVQRALKISLHDWALICISRGTDFVGRGVHRAPAWPRYVEVCSGFLQDARASLVRDEALDVTLVSRMLHSAARAGKGGAVAADGAWVSRARWNLEYWMLAPAGQGGRVKAHNEARRGVAQPSHTFAAA